MKLPLRLYTTLVLSLAGSVVLVAGCSTAPTPQGQVLSESDHPDERLRGEVRQREIGVEEAADRLDELRAEIGPEEPARFHLAAAAVNAFDGRPDEALVAVEAAMKADEGLVDDETRLWFAEQALHPVVQGEASDPARKRVYRHLREVDPDHPRLSIEWVEDARLGRLDELLSAHRPGREALSEAREICEQTLEETTRPRAFRTRCARVAHHDGDAQRARSLLVDWIDDPDGFLEGLDAALMVMDRLRERPGDDERPEFGGDAVRVEPDWKVGGALPDVHGAVGSPDGDRLATLHTDGESAPFVVVWDQTTNTEIRRFELPLRADDVVIDRPIAAINQQLRWHDDYLAVVTNRVFASLDLETGTVEYREHDHHRPGPAFSSTDGTITTATTRYPGGPIELTSYRITDLEPVDERRIWSDRRLDEWDWMVGDGTFVQSNEGGLTYLGADGSTVELELGEAHVGRVRLGPDGRYLYAIAENVHVVDLAEDRLRTSFGICPVDGADVEPTLVGQLEGMSHQEASRIIREYAQQGGGEMAEIDESDVERARAVLDGDSPLRHLETRCERPIVDRYDRATDRRLETTVTFVEDPEAELPWRPWLHAGERGRVDHLVDLTDGERHSVACADHKAGDRNTPWLEITDADRPEGDAESYIGENPDGCGAVRLCSPGFQSGITGLITNSPMVFGGGDSQTSMWWVGEDRRNWEQISRGRTGRVESLRFAYGGRELVESVAVEDDGVSMRFAPSGRLQRMVPQRFPLDATVIGGPGVLTVGPPGETRDEMYLGRASSDEGVMEGCAPVSDFSEGEVANAADADPPAVTRLEHASEEVGVESWFVVETDDDWLVGPADYVPVSNYDRVPPADGCPAAKTVAISAVGGGVDLLDVEEGGEFVERLEFGDDHLVADLGFDSDCRLAVGLEAVEGADHRLAVYEFDDGEWNETSRFEIDFEAPVRRLAWAPNDRLVVAADPVGLVGVSVKRQETVVVFDGISEPITALAVGPRARVVAGTADGRSVSWQWPDEPDSSSRSD